MSMDTNSTLPFGASPIEFWTFVLTLIFTVVITLSWLLGEGLLVSFFFKPKIRIHDPF